MVRRLAQMLVLLSVLLMPLAMSATRAATPGHADAHGAMAMGHCPDEGLSPDLSSGIAACSMACAAALPAFVAAVGGLMLPGASPRGLDEIRALPGLNPESPDPPPRFS